MATYFIHEVWYNLCIQFSSVNKGHSLLSPFTSIGSHVQYLSSAILVPIEMFCHVHSCTCSHSSYTQPNALPLCVPVWWKPFRLVSCSRGTKQVEALCKHEPFSGLDFTQTSESHQGRHAPAGDQNLTLSARLGYISFLPISLPDSLLIWFPALNIPFILIIFV